MRLGYLLVALLSVAITVFALQNPGPTTVRFLAWGVDTIPLAAVVLGSFAVGLLIAGVPLWALVWRGRRRARRLETQVKMLETNLADRDRALLKQPAPRPAPASPPSPPRPAPGSATAP